MKKRGKSVVTVLFVVLFVVVLLVGLLEWGLHLLLSSDAYIEVFETNNISDYGTITGNCDNNAPTAFITSFFPDDIDESFSDVIYHYKAKKLDTYAYEAYLEFVIEDPYLFIAYLEDHVDVSQSYPFAYDDSFMVYSISNVLRLSMPAKQTGAYGISFAEIGSIMYSIEENRIIYTALGVYDGGGADTSELNYFINRFDIDVLDYQSNAFYSHEDQNTGLVYKERG